ncbi:hypothetical protein F6X40_09985 [Paraburkholderia sp. UCT31]|uniref:hypothetical protein n=1 Tax=Paraburkholderia sp. UCT31 TaxID=2615209 RepID=UPI001655C28F|nr:hypothetical protein [Paraburkholderia sp. UCT31]MBC8737136.1 hypothetical protein [Paraburkholderia sp. UCT31]
MGWLEEAVNSCAWWPGDILGVSEHVPDEFLSPALDWLATHGLRDAVVDDEVRLLACEGATFHHDAEDYPDRVFCVLWLEETDCWDLVFPYSGVRIELKPGVIVLFDAANPHGVVARGENEFDGENMGDNGVQTFTSINLQCAPAALQLLGCRPSEPGSLPEARHVRLCQTSGAILSTLA